MSQDVTRTVTLELLRHGPAHNQLLSPLTRYLALCGNHPAETVMVPFEHQHFLTRLLGLQYKESRKTRELQLKETAQVMAEVLSGIPGLIAELSESAEPGTLTHLRLVLSAAELALLPFEMADAPHGLPGAGQPLALQAQLPLCITRQARRVGARSFSWPLEKPRILFAAASPPGVGAIPLESHLLVLRRAVEPWMKYFADDDERRRSLEEHLVFLPRASLRSIEQTCREGRFTHVHLLAHGVPIEEGVDQRFGLALHDAVDPSAVDRVDGIRLATALRTHQANGRLSKPAVVTLASCDSGAVGSVVGAGASLAHALHEAGVPLVVASQFPLSFEGSIVMTEVIYEGLLRGLDPRYVLSDVRRQLRTRVPDRHDWASLAVYATLPAGLPAQLEQGRVRRAQASIEAALDRIDRLIQDYHWIEGPLDSGSMNDEELRRLSGALGLLEKGKEWLQELSEDAPSELLLPGLLASAEKRTAQVLFQASHVVDKAKVSMYRERSRNALALALRHYEAAFQLDTSASWAVTQYLALSVILGRDGERFFDLWTLARTASEIDLTHPDPRRVTWAHSNLCELFILAPVVGGGTGLPEGPEEALRQALIHARGLLGVAGRDSFDFYAAHRQLLRYPDWFTVIMDFEQAEKVGSVARAVVGELEKLLA